VSGDSCGKNYFGKDMALLSQITQSAILTAHFQDAKFSMLLFKK